MSKFLKIFDTESDFKSCLYDKINGDNTSMSFPNISVIGSADSYGDYDIDKVYYIKDSTVANNLYNELVSNESGSGSGSGNGEDYNGYYSY